MSTRSPIWKIPEAVLREAVKKARTLTDALDLLGLKRNGSQYSTLKKVLGAREIDTSHFPKGFGRTISKNHRPGTPLEQIMVEDSPYSRGNLKARIIREGVLPSRCQGEGCEVGTTWKGKPMVLVLDHINGKNNDHRKENLRFLCPNCNSQTPTFSGRNLPRATPRLCGDCKTPISKRATRCKKCAAVARHA